MRITFTIIFSCQIIALAICAALARRSPKTIARPVMFLLLALIPPVAGNLILVISTQHTLSLIGCYIYFLGMDLVMAALVQFTRVYCFLRQSKIIYVFYTILTLDAIQILANLFTGHAFGMEEIIAYGSPYYRLIPYFGQTIHRIVDYGIVGIVLVIFLVKAIRSPRINSERYIVILITMIITTIWETLYIFSRTPVDRSMIGFGVFGLLVYYFSLYYRPLRLLDSMLATVASEMPDALFFFEQNGHCIWVNKKGIELAGIEDENFETVPQRLSSILGDIGEVDQNWSGTHITGTGDTVKSYVLERRTLTDERERFIGSFLSVRDNSDEQKLLQQEIYNATHDSLTHLYNRAGYDLLLSRMNLATTTMILIDADDFKCINDDYGHETGDHILQKIAVTIRRYFRSDDYVCRLGGDEFIVLTQGIDDTFDDRIRARIERINNTLGDTSDGLPPISVSAGIAHGEHAKDHAELFNHVDQALYETKRNGKKGFTCFTP